MAFILSGREVFGSFSPSVLYMLVFKRKKICFEGPLVVQEVGILTLYKNHSLYKSFDVLFSSL